MTKEISYRTKVLFEADVEGCNTQNIATNDIVTAVLLVQQLYPEKIISRIEMVGVTRIPTLGFLRREEQ